MKGVLKLTEVIRVHTEYSETKKFSPVTGHALKVVKDLQFEVEDDVIHNASTKILI